jgi:hypothetical protein
MKTCGILVLLVVALFPGSARAQVRGQERKQAIAGTVVEDSTKVPLPGAAVTVLRPEGEALGTAQADSLGRFRIPLDSAGRFRLRVEQPGYRTVNSDTVSVEDEEVLTVELRMARQAVPLEPLVVITRVDRRITAFYDRVRRGGFGHYLTRADIERRRGMRTTELIRFMPGVRVVQVSGCRGCMAENIIFLRGAGPGGSNECSPTVLIDGMEIRQDIISPLDALVMAEDLEGVEVYTDPGAAPADFAGVRNNCGVVALWTRPAQGKFSWKKLAIAAGIVLGVFLFFMR